MLFSILGQNYILIGIILNACNVGKEIKRFVNPFIQKKSQRQPKKQDDLIH